MSSVRCSGTRRGTGNELTSASFVSGASSQFGFDVVGLASLSTESAKLCPSSLVKLCIASAITGAPSTALRRALRVSESRAVAAGRSHPSRRPHVSQRCVLSVVPNKLPLPTRFLRFRLLIARRNLQAWILDNFGGVPTALFNDRVVDFPVVTDTTTCDAVKSKH